MFKLFTNAAMLFTIDELVQLMNPSKINLCKQIAQYQDMHMYGHTHSCSPYASSVGANLNRLETFELRFLRNVCI